VDFYTTNINLEPGDIARDQEDGLDFVIENVVAFGTAGITVFAAGIFSEESKSWSAKVVQDIPINIIRSNLNLETPDEIVARIKKGVKLADGLGNAIGQGNFLHKLNTDSDYASLRTFLIMAPDLTIDGSIEQIVSSIGKGAGFRFTQPQIYDAFRSALPEEYSDDIIEEFSVFLDQSINKSGQKVAGVYNAGSAEMLYNMIVPDEGGTLKTSMLGRLADFGLAASTSVGAVDPTVAVNQLGSDSNTIREAAEFVRTSLIEQDLPFGASHPFTNPITDFRIKPYTGEVGPDGKRKLAQMLVGYTESLMGREFANRDEMTKFWEYQIGRTNFNGSEEAIENITSTIASKDGMPSGKTEGKILKVMADMLRSKGLFTGEDAFRPIDGDNVPISLRQYLDEFAANNREFQSRRQTARASKAGYAEKLASGKLDLQEVIRLTSQVGENDPSFKVYRFKTEQLIQGLSQKTLSFNGQQYNIKTTQGVQDLTKAIGLGHIYLSGIELETLVGGAEDLKDLMPSSIGPDGSMTVGSVLQMRTIALDKSLDVGMSTEQATSFMFETELEYHSALIGGAEKHSSATRDSSILTETQRYVQHELAAPRFHVDGTKPMYRRRYTDHNSVRQIMYTDTIPEGADYSQLSTTMVSERMPSGISGPEETIGKMEVNNKVKLYPFRPETRPTMSILTPGRYNDVAEAAQTGIDEGKALAVSVTSKGNTTTRVLTSKSFEPFAIEDGKIVQSTAEKRLDLELGKAKRLLTALQDPKKHGQSFAYLDIESLPFDVDGTAVPGWRVSSASLMTGTQLDAIETALEKIKSSGSHTAYQEEFKRLKLITDKDELKAATQAFMKKLMDDQNLSGPNGNRFAFQITPQKASKSNPLSATNGLVRIDQIETLVLEMEKDEILFIPTQGRADFGILARELRFLKGTSGVSASKVDDLIRRVQILDIKKGVSKELLAMATGAATTGNFNQQDQMLKAAKTGSKRAWMFGMKEAHDDVADNVWAYLLDRDASDILKGATINKVDGAIALEGTRIRDITGSIIKITPESIRAEVVDGEQFFRVSISGVNTGEAIASSTNAGSKLVWERVMTEGEVNTLLSGRVIDANDTSPAAKQSAKLVAEERARNVASSTKRMINELNPFPKFTSLSTEAVVNNFDTAHVLAKARVAAGTYIEGNGDNLVDTVIQKLTNGREYRVNDSTLDDIKRLLGEEAQGVTFLDQFLEKDPELRRFSTQFSGTNKKAFTEAVAGEVFKALTPNAVDKSALETFSSWVMASPDMRQAIMSSDSNAFRAFMVAALAMRETVTLQESAPSLSFGFRNVDGKGISNLSARAFLNTDPLASGRGQNVAQNTIGQGLYQLLKYAGDDKSTGKAGAAFSAIKELGLEDELGAFKELGLDEVESYSDYVNSTQKAGAYSDESDVISKSVKKLFAPDKGLQSRLEVVAKGFGATDERAKLIAETALGTIDADIAMSEKERITAKLLQSMARNVAEGVENNTGIADMFREAGIETAGFVLDRAKEFKGQDYEKLLVSKYETEGILTALSGVENNEFTLLSTDPRLAKVKDKATQILQHKDGANFLQNLMNEPGFSQLSPEEMGARVDSFLDGGVQPYKPMDRLQADANLGVGPEVSPPIQNRFTESNPLGQSELQHRNMLKLKATSKNGVTLTEKAHREMMENWGSGLMLGAMGLAALASAPKLKEDVLSETTMTPNGEIDSEGINQDSYGSPSFSAESYSNMSIAINGSSDSARQSDIGYQALSKELGSMGVVVSSSLNRKNRINSIDAYNYLESAT